MQDYLKGSTDHNSECIAVKLLDDALTYRELDERSSQLANFLNQHGFGPGTNIGLYLTKSPAAVMAVFGILKAGATYVPLDTEAPLERIAYICSNCDLQAIVVDESGLKMINKGSEHFSSTLMIISLAAKSPDTRLYPVHWRIFHRKDIEQSEKYLLHNPEITEDSLAYLLYTSGSTGRPKGVMLSHRNAVVFVDWAMETFQTNRHDIFSSHAPFHFDLSILDIFLSVKSGATLCLIPPGLSYFADAMLRFIEENGITFWYSVPNAIIQWLPYKEELQKKLRSLRTLIYAGEVFPFGFLNELIPKLSTKTVYNLYGPTETNVITCFKIDPDQTDALTEEVPIGEPCSYAEIYIVDENNQPVKPGKTGELVVRGDSLMAGYWDNPKKTSSAIRNLEINGREADFYFTGDMVYLNVDQQIVYVNRRDNMVKTRGFRVELGEIESVLHKHEMIHQAAVVAIPDDMIGNKLIAFYTTVDNREIDNEDVVEFCADNLPTYMLPAKTIRMEILPRNTRGKIDRERLKDTQIKN